MARGRVRDYDDDRLVAMLACGRYTHAEIAAEMGLSANYVYKIAHGRRRNDIWRRVGKLRDDIADKVMLFSTHYTEALMAKHIQRGLGAEDETARKCREFILTLFLGPESR